MKTRQAIDCIQYLRLCGQSHVDLHCPFFLPKGSFFFIPLFMHAASAGKRESRSWFMRQADVSWNVTYCLGMQRSLLTLPSGKSGLFFWPSLHLCSIYLIDCRGVGVGWGAVGIIEPVTQSVDRWIGGYTYEGLYKSGCILSVLHALQYEYHSI